MEPIRSGRQTYFRDAICVNEPVPVAPNRPMKHHQPPPVVSSQKLRRSPSPISLAVACLFVVRGFSLVLLSTAYCLVLSANTSITMVSFVASVAYAGSARISALTLLSIASLCVLLRLSNRSGTNLTARSPDVHMMISSGHYASPLAPSFHNTFECSCYDPRANTSCCERLVYRFHKMGHILSGTVLRRVMRVSRKMGDYGGVKLKEMPRISFTQSDFDKGRFVDYRDVLITRNWYEAITSGKF